MNSKGAMIALAIIAFLMAAVLVLVIVRMLFGGRLRMPGGRARQARLGIVDAFDLDRQRQLIIVRRDNTEHLIMIGGPNDVLIESEIVRVEARDMRRDKAGDFAGASNDGRIPAPFAAPGERQDQPELVQPPVEPTQAFALPAEPMLPLTLPSVPHMDAGGLPPPSVEPVPQRTPTFPLPPRRPAPPERRPLPPRPADAQRTDPPRMEPTRIEGGTEAVDTTTRPLIQVPAEPSINAPVAVNLPPAGPAPSAPTPPPAPLVAPAPATPRTTPPSFLKPLPPRPPLRPLVRTNPRPPGAQETAAPPPPPTPPPADVPPIEPKPVEAAAPVVETPPTPLVQPPAPPVASPPEKDALESLEEEMAKLLGRGPG